MKKILFFLILCLGSINIYARKDTLYCKQSEVTKMTPVVIGIPDSVFSDEATPEQNAQAYFQRRPVLLERSSSSEKKDLGMYTKKNRSKILIFKKNSKGNWANTPTWDIAKSNTQADWKGIALLFISGLVFSILPKVRFKLGKIQTMIVAFSLVIFFPLLYLTVHGLEKTVNDFFWMDFSIILSGCVIGLIYSICFMHKRMIKKVNREKK